MTISIIIPTFNEAAYIAMLLHYLAEYSCNQIQEIIVSDGGSTDDTVIIAAMEGAKVVRSPQKGRAAQMNYGAMQATAPLLYFLHADTFPPKNFTEQILQSVSSGYSCGCFRLSFDYAHWFLKANCWFTRFDINNFRFGDQSLFVATSLFKKSGGFNEALIVMEDQEIIKRLKRKARFIVMKGSVVTSARKYLLNGIYKTQAVYFIIYLMYKIGYPQQKLLITYRFFINQNKL